MPPLLNCQSLSKSFGARPLFTDITLGIDAGERLGLIGPNGSGKSTLLSLFAGIEPPDSGEISRRRNLKLVTVAQEDMFDPEATVELLLDAATAGEVLEDYERTARKAVVLAQLGFTDAGAKAGTLSGGWKKRLALAVALMQEPELLLLDEPTNHLDLQGVLWLEALLKNAPFAFILISHDRAFLESVTNRIVELNAAYPEGYLSIQGSYSDFLEKKQEFLDAQAHRQHALEGQVKREIEWLRRGAPARTTKAQARIDSAERLIDELAETKFRNAQNRAVDFDFSATQRKTKELLVAKGVAKSLGGRVLFSDLDIALSPGTRLGLLGPNGSGKTTLLKILTGERESDAGAVRRADGLRVVVFDQNREQLDPKLSLRRALSGDRDVVDFNGGTMHVVGYANRFLFRSDQLERPLGGLSGGEQARVLIARLMLRPADLLILDEPTNDLDIPSLEVLEASLQEFPGAVVLVTHDRFMLDEVSTEMLALDGKGATRYFADYRQWEREWNRPELAEAKPKSAAPTPKPAASRRLSSQELRELNKMEEAIMAAEAEAETLQTEMNSPAVASDSTKLQQHWDALHAAQERVAKLYARWEELEEKQKRQNEPL